MAAAKAIGTLTAAPVALLQTPCAPPSSKEQSDKVAGAVRELRWGRLWIIRRIECEEVTRLRCKFEIKR